MTREQSSQYIEVNDGEFDSRVETESRWVHPFDREEVQVFVKKRLPAALFERLADSARPSLRDHPSVQENEDWVKITKYRERARLESGEPVEEIGQWVLRTLYEESFAVIPIPTLGGVVSHFYREKAPQARIKTNLNELIKTLDALDPRIFTLPLEEALARMKEGLDEDQISAEQLIGIVQQIGDFGIPLNNWQRTFRLTFPELSNIAKDPTLFARSYHVKADLERGWLFLQVFAAYQDELNALCSDEVLLNEFGLPERISRARALEIVWDQLGRGNSQVITERGGFRDSNDEQFSEGLRKLVVLRSSPDFSFLYQHFSAASAITLPSSI